MNRYARYDGHPTQKVGSTYAIFAEPAVDTYSLIKHGQTTLIFRCIIAGIGEVETRFDIYNDTLPLLNIQDFIKKVVMDDIEYYVRGYSKGYQTSWTQKDEEGE